VVNPSTVDHYVYLFGCTVAGVWEFMKVYGEILFFFKEPRNSLCFFYPCQRVLANLTSSALFSGRSLSTRLFGFAMLLASCVLYVCVFLHATLLSWWVAIPDMHIYFFFEPLKDWKLLGRHVCHYDMMGRT
jgi:hypothetical protein